MVGLIFILLFGTQDTVTVTTYKLTKAENGPYGNSMASGYKVSYKHPGNNRVIAVSPDLLEQFPYHTDVTIKGTGRFDGKYKVEDVMHPRWHKRIDILLNWKTKNDKFYNVIITKHGKHQKHIRTGEHRTGTVHNVPTKRKNKLAKRKRGAVRKTGGQPAHKPIRIPNNERKVRTGTGAPKRNKSKVRKGSTRLHGIGDRID